MEEKKSSFKTILLIIIAIVAIVVIVIIVNKLKPLSKEKMLEQAEYISWEDMLNDISNNQARAKEKYNGKYIISDVFVRKVDVNNCEIYVKDNLGQYLTRYLFVYLPTEELAAINIGDTIQVVLKCEINGYEPRLSGHLVKIVEPKSK